MIHHPLFILVAWAVFAVAAGVKFWRLTATFRRQLTNTASNIEQNRRDLERIWAKNQRAA